MGGRGGFNQETKNTLTQLNEMADISHTIFSNVFAHDKLNLTNFLLDALRTTDRRWVI